MAGERGCEEVCRGQKERTSGAKAQPCFNPFASRVNSCPSRLQVCEGKMPSRQPAGRRSYDRFFAAYENALFKLNEFFRRQETCEQGDLRHPAIGP